MHTTHQTRCMSVPVHDFCFMTRKMAQRGLSTAQSAVPPLRGTPPLTKPVPRHRPCSQARGVFGFRSFKGLINVIIAGSHSASGSSILAGNSSDRRGSPHESSSHAFLRSTLPGPRDCGSRSSKFVAARPEGRSDQHRSPSPECPSRHSPPFPWISSHRFSGSQPEQ